VGFRLSKWYLDCVTSEGDALIVYLAQLRWRELALPYACVLEHRAGETRVHTSLLGDGLPSAGEDELTWSSERLGVSGRWRALMPALPPDTLFASGMGGVEWRCLQPAASVAVQIRDEHGLRRVEGLGYAECLTLTVAPWSLPLDELHWGRFVGPATTPGEYESIVWIDWRGPHGARRAFRNGAAVDAAEMTAERITLSDGGVLSLDAGRSLRAGALGATVLAGIPKLATALPARMLGVRERKWCSRAVFVPRSGAATATRGWAIHEVVQWT
jgi:hypothetical protein